MNYDPETIESIVYQEILRVLNQSGTLRETGTSESSLCFLFSQPPEEQILRLSAMDAVTERYSCFMLKTASLEQISSFSPPGVKQEKIIPGNEPLDKTRAVILFQPTLSLCACAALGITEDPAILFLIHAMLQSIPVFGIKSQKDPVFSRAGKPDNPAAANAFAAGLSSSLESLRQKYEKILEQWGLKWIEPDQLFDSIHGLFDDGAQGNEKPEPSSPAPNERIIVTAEDVENKAGMGQTSWILPENAIVTDVARETAERLGFHLSRG